jgi:uncharacterized protein YerC
MKRVRILFKSDQRIAWTYEQIAEAFAVSDVTIAKVRKALAEGAMAYSAASQT